jgi:hypothetical protein
MQLASPGMIGVRQRTGRGFGAATARKITARNRIGGSLLMVGIEVDVLHEMTET